MCTRPQHFYSGLCSTSDDPCTQVNFCPTSCREDRLQSDPGIPGSVRAHDMDTWCLSHAQGKVGPGEAQLYNRLRYKYRLQESFDQSPANLIIIIESSSQSHANMSDDCNTNTLCLTEQPGEFMTQTPLLWSQETVHSPSSTHQKEKPKSSHHPHFPPGGNDILPDLHISRSPLGAAARVRVAMICTAGTASPFDMNTTTSLDHTSTAFFLEHCSNVEEKRRKIISVKNECKRLTFFTLGSFPQGTLEGSTIFGFLVLFSPCSHCWGNPCEQSYQCVIVLRQVPRV